MVAEILPHSAQRKDSSYRMAAEVAVFFDLTSQYVAAAPVYVAAAPVYVAAAPVYVAAAPPTHPHPHGNGL